MNLLSKIFRGVFVKMIISLLLLCNVLFIGNFFIPLPPTTKSYKIYIDEYRYRHRLYYAQSNRFGRQQKDELFAKVRKGDVRTQ